MDIVINHHRLEVKANTLIDEVILDKLETKSSQFVEITTRYGSKLVPVKKFYIKDDRNGITIFNVNQLEYIKSIIIEMGSTPNVTEVEYEKETIASSLELKEGMWYRDDIQLNYAKFLDETDSKCYLCTLQTGKGKTGSTLINLLSKPSKSRLTILIPPKYDVIWMDALKKFTKIKDKEILRISGRDSLVSIDEISDDVKVVILSPPTLREYIKSYYSGEEVPFKPEDILKRIGSEYLIIDEAHEDFAGNYSNVLALNPYKFIALTASYESTQDPAIVYRHKGYFIPKSSRLPEEEYDKYVNMVFCQFQFYEPHRMKFTIGSNRWYNHSELENSILKSKTKMENYFEMITFFATQYHNPKYRMLVLMARKDLCVAYVKYLKSTGLYKGKKISTFVQGDSKNNLKSDIIVSTKQSGGTGVDITNVQLTFNTINTKSEYAAKQFSGRSRFMDGVEQYYLILWATNIDAHRIYKRVNGPTYEKMAKTLSSNYYNRKAI